MFWGVTLDANRRYTQIVEKAFHCSMAALDTTEGKLDGRVSLMLNHEKADFLLCTLDTKSCRQQPLDLSFTEGEEITFYLSGKGHVHLSGYLLEEENSYFDDLSESESDTVPELVDNDKQKKNGDDRKRKHEKSIETATLNTKKTKNDLLDDEVLESDDDMESDEDLELDEDLESDEDEDVEEESEESEEEKLTPKKMLFEKTPPGKNTPGKSEKVKKDKSVAKQETNKMNDITADTPSTDSKKKKRKKNRKNSMDNSSVQTPAQSQGKGDATEKSSQKHRKKVLSGGTIMEEIKVGHGPEANSGKMVHVYYIGRLQNGKQFDSCQAGKPFRFYLGKNEVIKGWDTGVIGMKVGGKRKLTIPAQQGYGSQRQGPIPPNSVLVFDLELKSVS